MPAIEDLKIQIYADGADLPSILEMAKNPLIRGFTTNPTLMRKAGIIDYEKFARKLLESVHTHPVSLEVFADDFAEMRRQAEIIAGWGKNVNVKIPITNSKGESSVPLVKELVNSGVVLNVTAIMTHRQVEEVAKVLSPKLTAIVSVFAGRIADTGVDPVPHMSYCKVLLAEIPTARLLWASPRELLNVFQADSVGCDIITATSEVLAKLSLVGKSLDEYSLETVEMFRRDALAAAFKI
ncbi:MAG: transaldolase [Oxalobacteraceae bacterium]|jgi:transaldolase|nr:transaldolase [Oxalobacteraceae bacterium]